MKKPLLAIVGLAAAVILAVPAAAGAQAPAGDSVTGTGTLIGPGGEVTFVLDVHSGPSGENATGTLVNTTFGLTFTVNCLAVTGNRAVIGTHEIQGSFVIVEDNGSPGAGLDTLATTLPGSSCTEPGPPEFSPFTLTAGDFVVVDAQPFPTSKDQCKKGGWRNYGTTFKNQGHCVAFVQRGPKG